MSVNKQGVVVRLSATASGYNITVHDDDGTDNGAILQGPFPVVLRYAIKERNKLCERLSEEFWSVRTIGTIFVRAAEVLDATGDFMQARDSMEEL